MKRLQIVWAVGMVLILGSTAWGQDLDEYALIQGLITLTGPGGPVQDGNYDITSRVLSDPVGGIPLHEETHNSVAVSRGLFTIHLGSVTPIPDSLFKIVPLWLEIVVGSEVMTPRTRLTSVPRAFHVRTIDGAKGGAITGDVNVAGTITAQPPSPNMPGLSIQGSPGQTANLMEIKNSDGSSLVTFGPTVMLAITNSGSLQTPLLIQGSSGQTANLMEVKNSAGTPLVSVAPDGLVATPAIHLFGPAPSITMDNFPSPVPIRIKGNTGSLYIGHGTAVSIVQQDSVTPANKLQEWQNSAGAPLVSIGPDGDMDGLNSSWENLQAIDLNCDGMLNVNGPAVVKADAGQTANFTEWRRALPGGGEDTVAVVDANGNVGIGTANPTSTLDIHGSVSWQGVNVGACLGPYQIGPKDCVILVLNIDCQSCGVALPSAVGIKGRAYTIKHIGGSPPCAEPIYTFGSETIDGNPSYGVQPLKYVSVISDGANWWIIGSN